MVQAAMRRYNEIADKKNRGMTKEEILVHAGHTLLKAVSIRDEIQTLCEEAIENRTASVCIPPGYVKRVSNAYGDKLNVCMVIGFPLGYNITETKVYETRRALADGAGEVDMVVNLGDVKKGEFSRITREIEAVKTAAGRQEDVYKRQLQWLYYPAAVRLRREAESRIIRAHPMPRPAWRR